MYGPLPDQLPSTFPILGEWEFLTSEEEDRLRRGSAMRDGHGGMAGEPHRVRNDGRERWPGYAGPNGISYSANLMGDLAEKVYSKTTGLPMDERVVVGGVKGDDFPDGINVKATPHIRGDCCLIINPGIPARIRPRRGYALVALAEDRLQRIVGVILGWASNAEVEAADLVDYGYGPKHSIHHTKLHRPEYWLAHGAFPIQKESERV